MNTIRTSVSQPFFGIKDTEMKSAKPVFSASLSGIKPPDTDFLLSEEPPFSTPFWRGASDNQQPT